MRSLSIFRICNKQAVRCKTSSSGHLVDLNTIEMQASDVNAPIIT